MAGKIDKPDGGLSDYHAAMMMFNIVAKYGTTKISMTIAKGDQISSGLNKLDAELAKALNMNEQYSFDRDSAVAAIKCAQERLQGFSYDHSNGLMLFSGTYEEGEKEAAMAIEWPAHYMPITKSVFFCDNNFHTELFNELLTEEHEVNWLRTHAGAVLPKNRNNE